MLQPTAFCKKRKNAIVTFLEIVHPNSEVQVGRMNFNKMSHNGEENLKSYEWQSSSIRKRFNLFWS